MNTIDTPKRTIRLISDYHSNYDRYLEIARGAEYSIQLGDGHVPLSIIDDLDPNCHKFFGGNHNDYDFLEANNIPHNLGDYGNFELNGIKGFFIRGAFSIDKNIRLKGERKSWWEREQLTYSELSKAIDLYNEIKPDLVLTHTFPTSWCRKFGSNKILSMYGFDQKTFNTLTQSALQRCFELHKPKLWHGAHFHFNKNKVWHGTRFVCRRELGWTDIDENLNIIGSSDL